MLEHVEIAPGQLSMFDLDETKTQIYEALEANGLHDEIKSYYKYNDYENIVKFFYVRTTEDLIIDMCVSSDPQIFTRYDHMSEGAIKKIYKGRL